MNLDKLMSKHLTRYFDPSKTVPDETLQQLLRFLRSTPTSTNIQPSHFHVVATREGKERLADNLGEHFEHNSETILNASYTIILTTRADLPEHHVEAVFSQERVAGQVPDSVEQGMRELKSREFLDLHTYLYKDLKHWMDKQTYLALGMTMMAAAEFGVEAMPLEGFDPTRVDKAFKVHETGHTTTVLLALGYPDLTKVSTNPISRFEADQLFTFV